MDTIHEILSNLKAQPEKEAVLATIIHVDGSAYRKEGTSMLIFEDGTCTGVLSAGCLEEDLKARAVELINGVESAQKVTYDLRSEDDLSWGSGSGCNGVIRVMLKRVDETFRKQLLELKNHLDNRVPVLSIKDISGVERVIVPLKYEKSTGRWQTESGCHDLNGLRRFQKCNELVENKVFHQIYWPKPRLSLIGGGPDARPLAKIAETAGFEVHVFDWREAFCSRKHFSPKTVCHLVSMEEELREWKWSPLDAVMIMTHQFQKDKIVLAHLLKKELFYLGVLGPSARTAQLLEGDEIPSHVDTPAGIDIGAEGPEEIAISILGQVIRQMRKDGETANV